MDCCRFDAVINIVLFCLAIWKKVRHSHRMMNVNTAAAPANRLWMLVGINDEADTCEHCGKSGLKRVCWMQHMETLAVIPMGTSCAATVLGYTEKSAKGQQNRAERELDERVRLAADAYALAYPEKDAGCAAIVYEDRGTHRVAVLGTARLHLQYGNARLADDPVALLRELQFMCRRNHAAEFREAHKRGCLSLVRERRVAA